MLLDVLYFARNETFLLLLKESFASETLWKSYLNLRRIDGDISKV